MPLQTWFRYLLGNRAAILRIAQAPNAVWIGALFVLSAGLAREYDAEDLLHEPWHLLIPFAASLVTSFVLFAVAFGLLKFKGGIAPSFAAGYRAFLALFWLTAPLAWLYAIPYERFLDGLSAMQANLWTLALVSAWRVLLMARVLNVVMGFRGWQAFFLVMLLADAEALLALQIVPIPVWQVMGGVRQSPAEGFLAFVGVAIRAVATLSVVVWAIGALVAAILARPSWQTVAPDDLPSAGRSLDVLALASVVVWAFVLPFTQPEQQLRYRVEQNLTQGRIAEALAEMSAHEPTDFPPHWDPPPRLAYGQKVPPLLDVLEEIERRPPADWVAELFRIKQ